MDVSGKRRLYAGLAAAALLAGMTDGWAATAENFIVKTTSDLVALCETEPSQPNYVAAIHFCEGFGVGAYQYYLALAARDPAARYVCTPDPPPTRDNVKTAFVAWAKSNPSVMSDAPVNSLFRYLGQTYPCPAK
jgi:hypothetical protein